MNSVTLGIALSAITLGVAVKQLGLGVMVRQGFDPIVVPPAPDVPVNTLYFLDDVPVRFLDGGYTVWVQ